MSHRKSEGHTATEHKETEIVMHEMLWEVFFQCYHSQVWQHCKALGNLLKIEYSQNLSWWFICVASENRQKHFTECGQHRFFPQLSSYSPCGWRVITCKWLWISCSSSAHPAALPAIHDLSRHNRASQLSHKLSHFSTGSDNCHCYNSCARNHCVGIRGPSTEVYATPIIHYGHWSKVRSFTGRLRDGLSLSYHTQHKPSRS
jgi:hypothetical protein